MDRIAFGTDGWRATTDVFTPERVRMVAQAVATYLAETDAGDTVAVCYDARERSREFAEELSRVVAANGFDVRLPPRDLPTPLLAWTVADRGYAGGLMVTASHNPPEYNGVKFVTADGAPAPESVTDAIQGRLAAPSPLPEMEWGAVREVDFREAYYEHALSLVDADLDGCTVVYDAMHGSGRGVTDALLERAGATVVRERCDRDPSFGGTPPEPNRANLEGLDIAVDERGADLGVANDGDADRVGVVTPGRGVLDENLFFAALYDYLLERDAGPAVRTVSTTFLIDRIAAAHGQAVHETPVGFKHVAAALAEHDALVGGEESGGFTVRGHVPEKDGVLVALLAAAMAAERPLDERVDALLDEHGTVAQGKVNVDCPDDRKAAVLDALAADLPDSVAGVAVDRVNDADGFKCLLADGSWLLVRPSGTEPKLRVYAEAESEERVDELLAAGQTLVEPRV